MSRYLKFHLVNPTGMETEEIDGDYYDNKGNYIGNDGIDDDKIHVLN